MGPLSVGITHSDFIFFSNTKFIIQVLVTFEGILFMLIERSILLYAKCLHLSLASCFSIESTTCFTGTWATLNIMAPYYFITWHHLSCLHLCEMALRCQSPSDLEACRERCRKSVCREWPQGPFHFLFLLWVNPDYFHFISLVHKFRHFVILPYFFLTFKNFILVHISIVHAVYTFIPPASGGYMCIPRLGSFFFNPFPFPPTPSLLL